MTPKPDLTPIEAEAVVRAFLAAMEARDLARAQAMLAPGFEMVFPGPVRFSTLQALVDWSRSRYRTVRKRFAGIDAVGDVVYCRGTLSGDWPDGTPFNGIRFIDRFELSQGLLVRQEVWNDLAEHRERGQ
ncbi:MAG: nuclear transport factor 2 family protein [Pseudomonadota bacterium]